jgi:hypothetical protein
MLAEYDFSSGIRGKYVRRVGAAMIPGVQFVVDQAGQKTAVLIDLRTHTKLWEDFYDLALAQQRRAEPRESLAQLKIRRR